MNIHYLPCNVWNDAMFSSDNQENKVFRVYACQQLGPYIRKTIWKNGAMLWYIKVLLRTPAECMQRGTIRDKRKKNTEVLLLFRNNAASQRCLKVRNSNFMWGKMQWNGPSIWNLNKDSDNTCQLSNNDTQKSDSMTASPDNTSTETYFKLLINTQSRQFLFGK